MIISTLQNCHEEIRFAAFLHFLRRGAMLRITLRKINVSLIRDNLIVLSLSRLQLHAGESLHTKGKNLLPWQNSYCLLRILCVENLAVINYSI